VQVIARSTASTRAARRRVGGHGGSWLLLAPIDADRASYSPLIVLLVVVAVLLLTLQIVHRLYHGRLRGTRVGLRLSAADRAHAGHRGGLRPADPPGLRAFFRIERTLPVARRRRAALRGRSRTASGTASTRRSRAASTRSRASSVASSRAHRAYLVLASSRCSLLFLAAR
jgi:hypothetical protein